MFAEQFRTYKAVLRQICDEFEAAFAYYSKEAENLSYVTINLILFRFVKKQFKFMKEDFEIQYAELNAKYLRQLELVSYVNTCLSCLETTIPTWANK